MYKIVIWFILNLFFEIGYRYNIMPQNFDFRCGSEWPDLRRIRIIDVVSSTFDQ